MNCSKCLFIEKTFILKWAVNGMGMGHFLKKNRFCNMKKETLLFLRKICTLKIHFASSMFC